MTSVFNNDFEIAWCPGCGNYGILKALKKALEMSGKKPAEVTIISGIGQAGKTPHYINTNGFNGLHGRALPLASGVKISNPEQLVIIHGGDGDGYGEGGNHFIHSLRRNLDMNYFVHNNQIYGLTKGQASPTSAIGTKSGIQPGGTIMEPINPLKLAMSLDCGFIARGFSGDPDHLAELMLEAFSYKGFSYIDILQPCVVFNKVNTFSWYKEKVYKLEDSYDFTNPEKAWEKINEWDKKIPLGVIFKREKPEYFEKASLVNPPGVKHSDPKIYWDELLEMYK
jgi:2-oxoglutarate ferredoxin oxidoreductase subunit beta